MERLCLQIAVFLAALVPVGAGLSGVLSGGGFFDLDGSLTGQAHGAYLSGLLLATGIGFWSCVAHIETRSARFSMLTVIVVVGGLARLSLTLRLGVWTGVNLFALVMELAVTPALFLWQRRVASRGAP